MSTTAAPAGAAAGGPRSTAPVAAANPVAKLAAAALLTVAMVLTVDPVTAGVALVGELCVLPWCGLRAPALVRRLAPVTLAAVTSGLVTALLGQGSGRVVVAEGPVAVTTGSLVDGASIALRIAAIAVPGVVLLASTDPTDLADALAQRLHLPARFVLAGLAALRLVEVLAQEWRLLALARRARGLGGGGPLRRVGGLAGQAFSLLVIALRRAAVLATAMEARGFGAAATRTWARPSRLHRRDAVLVTGAAVLAGAATAVAVLAGTWHLVLS